MSLFVKIVKKYSQVSVFNSFIFIKRTLVATLKRILWSNQKICANTNIAIVLKIGGLGDFAFGVPALNLLRSKLPNANIVLITAKSLNSLGFNFSGNDPNDLSGVPWANLVKNSVDEILTVPDLSIQSIIKLRSLLPQDKKRAIFILGYPGMTFPSILKKFIFSRVLTNHSDICFGTNKFLDWKFMRKFQSINNLSRHKMLGDIDSVMEAFPGAAFDYADLDFTVNIPKNTVDKVSAYLNSKQPPCLILLAPLATTSHKQWPVENFVELVRRVSQLSSLYSFALIGTPDHYSILNNYFDKNDSNLKNFCGLLSISEIASLLSVAKGYIGNDGGMSQLAGLIGCPSVIAFNSVEEDWITYPWRSLNGVVRNKTYCSPCYNESTCPKIHCKCIVDLSIDSMFSRVKDIILPPSM